VLRIVVPVQIVAITVIMLPATLGYLQRGDRSLLFRSELLVHHSLGLIVVAIWVYINLVFMRAIQSIGRLVIAMRLVFFLWVLTLILGTYLYIVTWIL
jgi:hypothetical protein